MYVYVPTGPTSLRSPTPAPGRGRRSVGGAGRVRQVVCQSISGWLAFIADWSVVQSQLGNLISAQFWCGFVVSGKSPRYLLVILQWTSLHNSPQNVNKCADCLSSSVGSLIRLSCCRLPGYPAARLAGLSLILYYIIPIITSIIHEHIYMCIYIYIYIYIHTLAWWGGGRREDWQFGHHGSIPILWVPREAPVVARTGSEHPDRTPPYRQRNPGNIVISCANPTLATPAHGCPPAPRRLGSWTPKTASRCSSPASSTSTRSP